MSAVNGVGNQQTLAAALMSTQQQKAPPPPPTSGEGNEAAVQETAEPTQTQKAEGEVGGNINTFA